MRYMIRTSVVCIGIALFFFVPMTVVYAETPGGSAPGLENPLGDGPYDILEFFKIILNDVVVPVGAVVVAFFVIWSGFLFVTAGGDTSKLDTAKKTFTYTMIGAAVLLGAWTITQVIQTTVCQIAPDTPTLCETT